MVPIETEKRIDWSAVRAEYIAGGISQRRIAEKYGTTYAAVRSRADGEGWKKDREEQQRMNLARTAQKTADAVADNAVIAADLKKRMLLRLKRIEEKYPLDATEVRTKQGNSMAIFRIRDLTAAYKDLTDDMPRGTDAHDDPLMMLFDKIEAEVRGDVQQ